MTRRERIYTSQVRFGRKTFNHLKQYLKQNPTHKLYLLSGDAIDKVVNDAKNEEYLQRQKIFDSNSPAH